MLEPIKISLYSKASFHLWTNRSVAALLFVTLLSLSVTDVLAKSLNDPVPDTLGKPFDPHKIAAALMNPPIVPSEAQDLAYNFVELTLPKLLADDSRLAHRLGFLRGMNAPSILERPFTLLRIYRDDILEYIETQRHAEYPRKPGAQRDPRAEPDPLDVVNNTNNWLEGPDGKLVPKRIIFLIKTHDVTYSRISVTLEHSQSGAWRIIQVFAPKLSGAIKRFEITDSNQFVLWIPEINRHYLGEITGFDGDMASINLKALFEDQLTDRKVGEKFNATSKEFLEHLGNLYRDLNLAGKSRPSGERIHIPESKVQPR